MTINEFLAEQGLTPEEITAVVGNEKQAKAMTAALDKFNVGHEALTKAEAAAKETDKYWADKTTELQNGVNRLTAAEKRAAKAEAEAAQRTAYLKSLKAQGYDVPDDVVGEVTPPTTPPTPQYVTRDDWEKASRGIAPDLVTLTALQARYQHLYGQPYIDIDKDFAEAQKAGKPLAEYASTKYNFAGKQAEMAQKADQERLDKYAAEKVTAAQAEWAKNNGSNSNTSAPRPSTFDKLQKERGIDANAWKSPDARKVNKESRRARYENMLTHVN
jgi:hypothetical protein